jgi:two-component system sensor histidine kinase KdpD
MYVSERHPAAKGPGCADDERLLVLISSDGDQEPLIRSGQQLADRQQHPWTVAWVDSGQVPDSHADARLQSALALAKALGATTETLRGPNLGQTVMAFLAERRIRTVMLGVESGHRGWPWRKPLYRQLVESSLPLDVRVVRIPAASNIPRDPFPARGASHGSWHGYAVAALTVLVAMALAVPLEYWVENYNLVLIYVLAVVATGLGYGSRAAIFASMLAFLSFNFFMTDPRYTFEVARQDELATLVFLLLIALICGPAASRIRRQFILLKVANRSSESMRLLGQQLSVAEDAQAAWLAVARELGKALQAECCLLVWDKNNLRHRFPGAGPAFGRNDEAAIEWSRQHLVPSGRLTDCHSGAAWTLFPVHNNGAAIAVAAVKWGATKKRLDHYDQELISAMLQQAADTWRRIQLVGDLESARVTTEVERLRSALLSSVSHDLKSPLAAMMGAAESLQLLEKQLQPQDRQELLDTILHESRRLEAYIQNLLDMTRLGHGTLKIERDWVPLADIIGSTISRLKRYSPDVKIEYRTIASQPLLYVHAALIEQALFNILENALRFSPAGEPVRITVRQRQGRCWIEIEDQGPGIPESLREQVFDMFYVVSEGDQRKQSTGMGLAICRGMINAHGGTVRVMDGTGHRGSRFVVELPVESPPPFDDDREMDEDSA